MRTVQLLWMDATKFSMARLCDVKGGPETLMVGLHVPQYTVYLYKKSLPNVGS